MRYLQRLEGVVRWSVFLLIAFTPLFFIPLPWVTVVQAKLLFVTILVTAALASWIAASFSASRLRILTSPLLAAAALIPIAYIVSAIATGASWGSFIGDGTGQDTVAGFLMWYAVLFLSALVLSGGRETYIPALRLFLGGGFLVILVQLVHLIFPSFSFGGALPVAPSSVVGSWHDLAIFLGLLVFLSVALLRTSVAHGLWYYLALANAVLGAFLLIVIQFADVWFGLGLLFLLYAFYLFRTRELGLGFFQLRALHFSIICVAVAVGFFFGGSFVQAKLPAPLQVSQVEVRPSWAGTFEIGREVFSKPSQIFFGSGPNTFPREWGMHKPLSVNTTQFWNTDFYYGVGFIPTSVVTTGVLGFLAWGAVCFALLFSVLRWLKAMSGTAKIRTVLLGSALYLTAFHLLYVPGPTISFLTFLVFGMLVAEEFFAGSARERFFDLSLQSWKGRGGALILSLLGLILIFGGAQSVRALVSDTLVNRAVSGYAQTGNLEDASRSISRAIWVLSNNDRAHRAAVELGLLQLSALIAKEESGDEARVRLETTLKKTIEHGLTAVSIESGNYQNWLAIARLYAELAGVGVEGAEQSAREAYASAKEGNPTSPLPYLGLAQLDLLQGDERAATENLEAALSVKPDFAAAHYLISQAHARAGAMNRAQEHAAVVVEIAPDDPLGWYNLGSILYVSGNMQGASLALERAAGLNNSYADALFLLALSYARLDRTEDALRVLGTVAELVPDNDTIEGTIQKIENGESVGILQ